MITGPRVKMRTDDHMNANNTLKSIAYRFFKPGIDFFRHYIGGLYHRIDDHHVFLLASGLAFSLIVCIIPLILIVFAALGVVLEKTSITEEIDLFIEGAIPYKDYATFIKNLILSRVEQFKFYKSVAGVVGSLGLLFAASGLFSSMRTILNKAYRIPTTESILIGKLRDLGLILLVLFYFLLSTAVLPGWELTKEFADNFEFLKSLQFDFVEDLLLGTVSFFIIFISFFTVYFLVPHQRQPKKVILVSALSASILWKVAEQIFGFYITNFITLKWIYGAYVLLIVVAFWIFYTSLVFILGAEIGQLYRERRQQRLTHEC